MILWKGCKKFEISLKLFIVWYFLQFASRLLSFLPRKKNSATPMAILLHTDLLKIYSPNIELQLQTNVLRWEKQILEEDSSSNLFCEFHVILIYWKSISTFLPSSKTSSSCPIQWRRQDFFRGGRHGHLKAIRRHQQAVRGRRPADGSEISFFKTMQSIRKRIEFSKISTFFLPINLFFLRKIRKIEHVWQGFLNIFEELFENLHFCETYKSRENLGEFYFLVEKFTVARQGIFSEELSGH